MPSDRTMRRRPATRTDRARRPLPSHEQAIDVLAAELAKRMVPMVEQLLEHVQNRSPWMTSREAADHLRLTTNALDKHCAARAGIPFHQDVARGKRWFHRDELDDWRRGSNGSR